MKSWFKPWRRMFALLLLTGCGTGLRADSDADLQATVDSLDERVAELEAIHQTSADLTPGGPFDFVSTDIGQLTLSLDKVVASEKGLLASLTIGNTTAAALEDVEAKVSWGSSEGSLTTTRKLLLANRLAPGTWTKVTVVLDTAAAGGVGAMRVTDVSYGGIALK